LIFWIIARPLRSGAAYEPAQSRCARPISPLGRPPAARGARL